MPKVEIQNAKSKVNTFHLSKPVATTERFYEPNIVYIKEIRKGSSGRITMSALRRVAPMPLPSMSSVRFNTRFYYVPMVDICPYYNQLDERTPYAYRSGTNSGDYNSEIPLKVPALNSVTLLWLLTQNIVFDLGEETDPLLGNVVYYIKPIAGDFLESVPYHITMTTPYDKVYETDKFDLSLKVTMIDGHNNTIRENVHLRYTAKGRRLYKMLKQLGYDYHTYGFTWDTNRYNTLLYKNVEFSALPLLAFLKVYLNFYESSQYINNTTRLAELNALLHIDKSGYSLTVKDLELIFDLYQYMTYENDYFTTAFVNAQNGNNFIVNNESINIIDNTIPTNPNIISSNTTNGTATLNTGGGRISANGVKLLQRLNNFLKRMQVSGGRMVDRALAEYGIGIDNAYSRRCSYIDSITSVLSITPVINTTDTQLGDYAGFGSSGVDGRNKNNVIEFNIPEQDGYIIAIDTIVPEIMYSQGYRRENRHLTKWDFVASTDFDAVGVQATEQGEILMSKDSQYEYANSESPANLTFGFKPRGAEYKEDYGIITGDFICPSVNTDIDGYFTDRRFDPINYLDNQGKINITTGREFVSSYGSGQFSRIFYYNANQTDYIYSVFRFELELRAPYRALYEEYQLKDSDGSGSVKMEVGGQTMQ